MSLTAKIPLLAGDARFVSEMFSIAMFKAPRDSIAKSRVVFNAVAFPVPTNESSIGATWVFIEARSLLLLKSILPPAAALLCTTLTSDAKTVLAAALASAPTLSAAEAITLTAAIT